MKKRKTLTWQQEYLKSRIVYSEHIYAKLPSSTSNIKESIRRFVFLNYVPIMMYIHIFIRFYLLISFWKLNVV